jgi:hypothetical protein
MLSWKRLAGIVVIALGCGDSPAGPDAEGPTDEIRVYFTRGGVPQPVIRSIFPTFEPLPIALAELLEGPTAEERANGFTSFFDPQTASAFDRAEIRDDSLVVIDFLDFSRIIPGASTSAGAALLLGELNHTVFQFAAVKSVIYRFNGSCTRFFTWLNQPCRTIRREAIANQPVRIRVPLAFDARPEYGLALRSHSKAIVH